MELKDSFEKDRCVSQREVALLTQELSEVREELEEVELANRRLEAEISSYRQIMEELEGKVGAQRWLGCYYINGVLIYTE